MSDINYRCKETMHPITNDVMWIIDDISLASGGLFSLIEQFITQYPYQDFSLSIYDNETEHAIGIICDMDEMPQIVEHIYHLEKGTPLTFVGVNSVSKSYVVGMSISQGRIEFGCYKADKGKLKKI